MFGQHRLRQFIHALAIARKRQSPFTSEHPPPVLNIFRNIHHHRPRATAAGDVKGFFHDHGNVTRILDQEVVFDDGPRDPHGIALLKGIEANRGGGNLTGDHDQGNAVHIGRGNTSDRIGHAGAGSDQGHANFSRGAGISVGGMHRRLFVAHQNVLHGVLTVDGVVDIEGGTTRITPDVFDLFGLQGFDQDVGPHQLGGMVIGGGSCLLQLGGVDFHGDEPLRISKTKYLGCSFGSSCGTPAELWT